MKIEALKIKNYKFIHELEIRQMENACILVGRNNTGKTVILDAVLTACGQKEVKPKHFNEAGSNIEITVKLSLSGEDIALFYRRGRVSRAKRRDVFEREFGKRLPSFQRAGRNGSAPLTLGQGGVLEFTFVANKNGRIRYSDGLQKDNPYIKEILPKIYCIDHRRNIDEIEDDIIQMGIREKTTVMLRENKCMFDEAKPCNACFQCIGKIEKKAVEDLTIFETEKLLEYKLLHADSDAFMQRLNEVFRRNTGLSDTLVRQVNIDLPSLLKIDVVRRRERREHKEYEEHGEQREQREQSEYSEHGEPEKSGSYGEGRGYGGDYEPIYDMGEGMKSIYILSLLETYMEEPEKLPCILMMEDPELFLHPQLQKMASEVLYRLSQKNQIIFSTHSPTMIFNFNKKQIKQMQLDRTGHPLIREQNDIGRILDDLGFSANDLMNVSFVFIVEGKQDRSRLPLLLNQYYSEMYDENGNLQRIAIISTNSCTNIKTYANLKYMNQIYLKDQLLMIRDSDGKNPEKLKRDLCSYYANRSQEDVGALPRISPKNVLILKYYSFENYFLNPKVMAKIGVIPNEEAFYDMLYDKYKEYLHRIKSFVRMREKTGIELHSKKDIKKHLETILIYGRGHNLYDIFYGRYKGEKETTILKRYIETAGREVFADILDAIDAFVYFQSRKKGESDGENRR